MPDTIFDKITMIMPILHQLQINIILAVDHKSLLTNYILIVTGKTFLWTYVVKFGST